MHNTERIHDHSFNTTSAESLLSDFENRVNDKVFVAAYALEKKMKEIVPPVEFGGWRMNCFDTYNPEEQFKENEESLEIRNDGENFDFRIGKKALSDLSEASDAGGWEELLKMVVDHMHATDPKTTDLYKHRKKVYENLVTPFKLKRTIYFQEEAFDFDVFLKKGIEEGLKHYKEKQDIVIVELDNPPIEFEDLTQLSSTIILDEYRDF